MGRAFRAIRDSETVASAYGIQPVLQMDRGKGFNQVFFEDVRVPRANLLGELNRGWYIAQNTLGMERGPITLSMSIAACGRR